MYLQILYQIQQKIAVGEWKPGDGLPSIRQLATTLGVSVITVKRAYLELEREGVIVTQHGKGSFVGPNINLGSHRHNRDFLRHLEQAVRLAAMMGLSREQLARRLFETRERLFGNRWVEER